MSHSMVVGFGVIMASFSTGLYYAGVSMGYLYLLMGVIVSSAVLPASLTLLWKGQNKWAATLSPILGLICSVIAWLVTASKEYDGVITVETTGKKYDFHPIFPHFVAVLTVYIWLAVTPCWQATLSRCSVLVYSSQS